MFEVSPNKFSMRPVSILLVLGVIGFLAGRDVVWADELRDPMRPPALALKKFREAKWASKPRVKTVKPVKKVTQKPFLLSSILISKQRKIAIIDDQLLVVGDKIRGARVIRILAKSARLLRRGKVIELRLDNELIAVKKPTTESDI